MPLPHLTGAAWLAWRQHRATYRTVAAVSALFALWALWERRELVSGVHAYARSCLRLPQYCHDGSGLADPSTVHLLFDQVTPALTYLAPVAAALIGATLFAQDMENGAHRLAWTQSIGRREWTVAKLVLATAVTVAGAVLVTAPVTWWWYTNWRGQGEGGIDGRAWRATSAWNDWSFFSSTGPAGVAHILLALMIGAAAGLLLRRLTASIALAAAVTGTVQWALARLRPHLLTPHLTEAVGTAYPTAPRGSWYLGGGYIRADGTTTGYPCSAKDAPDPGRCLGAHGIVGQYRQDLPLSRLPLLQTIETGICVTAAVALVALCLWRVGRNAT
ncbi:ABC transporter permease subunit [Streptomyces liangshanensis]|uniref:ABC transporter permease subunit n=1 Tax=Streptomyces liangshanensis TaxID=2717324 RepID=UPI0036D96413